MQLRWLDQTFVFGEGKGESESGWALTKRLGKYLREMENLKSFKNNILWFLTDSCTVHLKLKGLDDYRQGERETKITVKTSGMVSTKY